MFGWRNRNVIPTLVLKFDTNDQPSHLTTNTMLGDCKTHESTGLSNDIVA